MDSSEQPESSGVAHLTIARHELEAEIICSMLRAEGIRCMQRPSNLSIGDPWMVLGGAASAGEAMRGAGGPRDVLVEAAKLEEAKELLATHASDFEGDVPE